MERDTVHSEMLEAAIADAGRRREVARMEIREHEATAHNEQAELKKVISASPSPKA